MLEDANSSWWTPILCLVDANPAREKFSSDTERVVGSLLLLAVYFSWRYILVGGIF
jgi:hypothetical protein